MRQRRHRRKRAKQHRTSIACGSPDGHSPARGWPWSRMRGCCQMPDSAATDVSAKWLWVARSQRLVKADELG